jgi:hypothetical protein
VHRLLIGATCVSVFATAWLLTGQGETSGSSAAILEAGIQASAQGQAETTPLRVQVPPPPFSEGIFPCSDCHNEKDLPTNYVRRTLVDAHDDIVLKHDAEHRWCLDCHDAGNRDQLHLASGEPVPFPESYRLCGQCHGEKYRDWRVGVHGRRVGQWNGAKEYLLCVHCHNPHEPRFKPLKPKPAPRRPARYPR